MSAKTKIKFIDAWDDNGYISTFYKQDLDIDPELYDPNVICIKGFCTFPESGFSIILDIPTAIKFAKTIRTEINKAKEGGSNNG